MRSRRREQPAGNLLATLRRVYLTWAERALEFDIEAIKCAMTGGDPESP